MPVRERVGPYRLLEEIGVGGMGEVSLALDPHGRTVAVKVLHPAVARDEVSRRRLEREVATMRRVRSPHVAEVVGADFTGRRPYIVTRYVEGRSLAEVVRTRGPLRGAALLRLARGLARALAAVHAAGVVHRDLKPANVIVVGDEPVVIDFGLAHVLDATRLTRTGTAIGTPGYLAPEVLDGERAGPKADVFSWAATVVFAATGRSPYGSGPAQAIYSRVLRGRFDLSGVPRVLLPTVRAALALDPGARPVPDELLKGLAAPAAPAAAPADPPRPHRWRRPRGWRPLLLAVPALCYLAPVLAGGALLFCAGTAQLRNEWRRAHRRSARGPLRRRVRAAGAVPFRVAVRMAVLVLALAACYGLVFGIARALSAPVEMAVSLPVGVLAAGAVCVRSWYAAVGGAAEIWLVRLGTPLLTLATVAAAAAAVGAPLRWPL
ncbi:serine/threonine-protein kinase [Actinomadura sp. HBU206391]|uniref:serine/threonine-protein kinase n=1 Tax=Actinomadura sp. HBU206391 TaxID=2731692 RepID=UPI0016503401|nr:serine/threonine-protein kinase [Actinomadura sp. HBU206391]MBC6459336.1 serine/threonine protein kinase [Actinomadura sp. HBU206391]